METKKSPKADLESKRAYFTEIGFILSISLMFVIFGWKTYDFKEIEIQKPTESGPTEWDIPITKHVLPTPPAVIATPTMLDLVDNDKNVVDIDPIDAGDNLAMPIPVYTLPVPPKPDETPIIDEPVIVADIAPEFPGGYGELRKFLKDNLVYPSLAKEVGITGTVHLSFVVERDGSVTNIRLQRGIGGGCDEEAVRVVQMMPRWSPGWVKGRLVRTSFSLPVKFDLR